MPVPAASLAWESFLSRSSMAARCAGMDEAVPVRPPALADTGLHEERGIGEGGKDALADQ